MKPFDRSLLDGDAIFRSIARVTEWLLFGWKPVYPPPSRSQSPDLSPGHLEAPMHWEEVTSEDIKRLQLVLNTQLKLLSKVLPDLKAIEISDLTTNPDAPTDLAALERRIRGLAAIREAQAGSGSGSGSSLNTPRLQ